MTIRTLTVLAAALLACGCGKQVDEKRVATVPVSGKLLVDGKPFGPALLMLTLNPPNVEVPSVNGYVKGDGTFELKTYQDGDGAPAGSYNVTLTMNPSAMGPVPQVKPATVEIKTPDSGSLALDVNLESTGQMSSPLPPPPGMRLQ